MNTLAETINDPISSHTKKSLYEKLIDPEIFGYYPADVRSSCEVKNINYDKSKPEIFFTPDFLIHIQNVPCIVVASCSPDESLESLLAMARLYAFEINNQFEQNVNPCQKIIATDGNRVMMTKWMQPRPMFTLSYSTLTTNATDDAEKLLRVCSRSDNVESVGDFYSLVADNYQCYRPSRLLSKDFMVSSHGFENDFGKQLLAKIGHVFEPKTLQDRVGVVNHSFVVSSSYKAHCSIMTNIIIDAIGYIDTKVSDPDNVQTINLVGGQATQELGLVSGIKGSGKSAFFDFLQFNYLPEEMAGSVCWCRIDMQTIEPGSENLADRIFNDCCHQLLVQNKEIDIKDLTVLAEIFPQEYQVFCQQTEDSSAIADSVEGMREVAFFNQLVDNKPLFFSRLLNYVVSRFRKLPIIVIDNADEHIEHESDHLVKVLQDLSATDNNLTFISLSDKTVDKHQDEYWLDRASNFLNIRIEPPAFEDILQSRLAYAMFSIGQGSTFISRVGNNSLTATPNHIMLFLNCVYNSCFDNSRYSTLLKHLVDGNIRKGIELFVNCCASGHISDKQLKRMFTSSSDFLLPNHTVMKILAKPKNRYFNDAESHIKNLFHSYELPGFPDPFVRFSLLHYLQKHAGLNEDNALVVDKVILDLKRLGHKEESIRQQISELQRAECLEVIDEVLDDSARVRIKPFGEAHIDLLKDLTYISMVSEDTLFDKSQTANAIAKNIMGTGDYLKDSPDAELNNCFLLIEYLDENHQKFFSEEDFVSTVLTSMKAFIKSKIDSSTTYNCGSDEITAYPQGTEVVANITSVQNYGIFVGFDQTLQGLIHKSNITLNPNQLSEFKVGDAVRARVISFSKKHRRFSLQLLERIGTLETGLAH